MYVCVCICVCAPVYLYASARPILRLCVRVCMGACTFLRVRLSACPCVPTRLRHSFFLSFRFTFHFLYSCLVIFFSSSVAGRQSKSNSWSRNGEHEVMSERCRLSEKAHVIYACTTMANKIQFQVAFSKLVKRFG